MSIAKKMKIQVWLKASNERMNTCEFETPWDAVVWTMTLPTDGAYTITGRNGNGSISAISIYNDAVDRYIKPFSETGKPSMVMPLTQKRGSEREVGG